MLGQRRGCYPGIATAFDQISFIILICHDIDSHNYWVWYRILHNCM